MGVKWLAEVELIDRPKEIVPSARSVIEGMLRATARDPKKVVKVPKTRQGSIQAAYLWAKAGGYRMSMETNDGFLYLRWDKKKRRAK